MRRLAALCLFAGTLSFALGVSQPLLVFQKLWLLTDKPSLVDIVAGLWGEGERLLAVIVGLFSVVLPALKLALLAIAAADPDGAEPPSWIKALAGWSMLDVLVAALVVFAAKTSALAEASTLPGLWFFVLSVFLTAAAAALLRKSRVQAGG